MAKHVLLYHGSDQQVMAPTWNHGDKGRDFGQCFYTTYSRETAKDWAEKNHTSSPVVNQYAINLEQLGDGVLRVKRFEANAEWAEFVWNNRYNPRYKRPAYDIIIGPIADKGLKEHFMKMRTQGKTFAEIAPLIRYDRFRSMQVCFCSDYAVKILNPQC